MTMHPRKIICSQCIGTGKVRQYTPHHSHPEEMTCPQCNGTTTIEVVVPDEKDDDTKGINEDWIGAIV